jgi:hypothetical protein
MQHIMEIMGIMGKFTVYGGKSQNERGPTEIVDNNKMGLGSNG